MNPLNERDAEKLVKLLGRLGSDHDGEVAAAGAMASRFVRERGLTWADVVRPTVPAVSAQRSSRPSPATPSTWREVVARCRRLNDDLDVLIDWEWQFLVALSRRRFPPTEKQLRILDQLQLKVGQPPW